jgi:FAD/FMN-containing dehydrogenase
VYGLKISRRSLLLTLGLVSAFAFSTRKVLQYAAEPSAENDCTNLLSSTPSESIAENGTAGEIPSDALPWGQKGGYINDASCLNSTAIYGVVQVVNEDDIRNAILFAREQGLKVSLAGVRHSMGGQAFYENAIVLDMTHFNEMALDEQQKILTVQSGATWHDIQEFFHPTYAVKAMQSTDIFTVGGSVSVNAHGMDHQAGAVGSTIRSMRLMLMDGSVKTLSRDENEDLFRLVIGGYGLFGVILEVALEVTENVVYETGRRLIHYQDFPDLFENELAVKPSLGLMYSHLSTSPQSLLREMILYTYEDQPVEAAEIPPLGEVSSIKLRRLILNFSKLGPIPMRVKWFAEKHIEPRLESCTVVARSQAMSDGEACLVSRNEPMHDSVKYLKNDLAGETDILQEYFVPRSQFLAFVDGLREIVVNYDVNLLNASVRVVHQEDNFLNYAPVDMFSLVLYINQKTNSQGNEKMRVVTGEIIDLTTQVGGRFFLPYQLHYSKEQLEQAYPEIGDFFAAKRAYDPDLLLTNTFYEKYAPSFEGSTAKNISSHTDALAPRHQLSEQPALCAAT